MAITITFGTLTDEQRLRIAELKGQLDALDKLAADIQTDRATKESKWNAKLNAISTKKDAINDALRAISVATLTEA